MESEGTDPFVIPPSWAMVRMSQSRTHASTLTDPQTTEKWPGPMSRRLQALMIEHRLFAIYKHEPASARVLQQVVEALCPYFDPPLDRTHARALVEKTKNKINRIRAELLSQGTLVKTNTGFILASDQPEPADDGSRHSQRIRTLERLLQEWEPGVPPYASVLISKTFLISASVARSLAAGQANGDSPD
jgi:hypothetical protein